MLQCIIKLMLIHLLLLNKSEIALDIISLEIAK